MPWPPFGAQLQIRLIGRIAIERDSDEGIGFHGDLID
jgi:hypothetical protein